MKRSALLGCLLLTCACQVQMRAESSLGGAGTANAKPAARAKTTHKGSSHKGGGRRVSVSFHKEGSISGKLDWQGRSGSLCRAVSPFQFVGTAKLAGKVRLTPSGVSASGQGQASGKSSGGATGPDQCSPPRTHVPATPAAKPVTRTPTDSPPNGRTRPSASDFGTAPGNLRPVRKPKLGKQLEVERKPSAKPESTPEPTKPTSPTPTELEKPQDPPAEPPPNVFGYDTPVAGCFEGQVFPLAPETPRLPSSYESLSPVSVVYACEWDIAPREWDQGFPGIADRFEWFAIRYAGAFRVSEAGSYAFRLSSDDGSKLIIDDKVVIDNDSLHPPQEARGTVQLSAGDHQMVLEYFQGPRYYINLQLWVTPPGKAEELFTVR